MAALSSAVYLPLELSHQVALTKVINLVVLGVNLAVVAYMMVRLRRRRNARGLR